MEKFRKEGDLEKLFFIQRTLDLVQGTLTQLKGFPPGYPGIRHRKGSGIGILN